MIAKIAIQTPGEFKLFKIYLSIRYLTHKRTHQKVRLPLILSPDEYDVSIKTYEAALEFYAYIFDFGKRCYSLSRSGITVVRQESILPTYSTAQENDYDGSSLSEDSEGFLGCIDID